MMLFRPLGDDVQDEKAMGVLRNVGAGWRLFWVLEVIGSSFWLAVLAVRLTGNRDTVQGGDPYRCESDVILSVGCSIYDWFFVLHMYPLAVTAFSLLVTRVVSRPASPVGPAGGLGAPSRGCNRPWSPLAGVCWALYRVTADIVFALQSHIVSTAVGVTALLAGGVALSCGRGYYGRRLRTAYGRGSQRFRPVDRKRRRLLFWIGLLFCAVRAVSPRVLTSDLSPAAASDVLNACYAVYDSFVDAWLLFGMGLADLESPSVLLGVDPSRPLRSLLWPMLVGWSFFEGYTALRYWVVYGPMGVVVDPERYWRLFPAFALAGDIVRLAWSLTVGTLLWGWTGEVRAVAFWLAANRLIRSLLWCMLVISLAARELVVT